MEARFANYRDGIILEETVRYFAVTTGVRRTNKVTKER